MCNTLVKSHLVQVPFAQRTVKVLVQQEHVHNTLCTNVAVVASANGKHLHSQRLSNHIPVDQMAQIEKKAACV